MPNRAPRRPLMSVSLRRGLRSLPALLWLLGLLLLAGPRLASAQAKDPQLVPNRLASTGDSITEAINAEEFYPVIIGIATPNPWASFVNGYPDFLLGIFPREDVNSHNQRISEAFGEAGRQNFMNALSGADSRDLSAQASLAVAQQATYVTLFMGHNDVCQDSFAQIPTDAEYEANVRTALDQYQASLPAGATIYLIGLVDIYSLWQLGDELDALGIIPCDLIWATTLLELFPCGTMLSPANSEADRQFTRGRNIAFNQILEALAAEYQANDPHHYYLYTNEIFETQFVSSQVSEFDCFHPSADGQRELAERTWQSGPFPLPEPAVAGSVLLGVLGLVLAERRRRARSSRRAPSGSLR